MVNFLFQIFLLLLLFNLKFFSKKKKKKKKRQKQKGFMITLEGKGLTPTTIGK